jgi:hypothetical protein
MPYVKRDDYFEYKTSEKTLPDTIIVSGGLVGITKFGYLPNETALAYLEGEYLIPITALASEVTTGTPVYITTNNVITTDAVTAELNNTKIGTISRDANAGATGIYFFINR